MDKIRNLAIGIFVSLTCASCQGVTPAEAEAALTARYGVPCEVQSLKLAPGRGLYVGRAKLETHPDVSFTVEFNRQTKEIHRDNFYQSVWTAAYRRLLAGELKNRFQQFAFDVSFSSSFETDSRASKYLNLPDLLDSKEAKNRSELRLYLFGKPEIESLKKVRELVLLHKSVGLESSAFELRYYRETSHAESATYPFGFRSTFPNCFERKFASDYLAGIRFTLESAERVPKAEEIKSALDSRHRVVGPLPHRFSTRSQSDDTD